jgi:serine/threonine protein kinase
MGESAKNYGSIPPPTMGRYTPFARLGDGGMAEVFLAVARGPAGFNKLTVIKQLRNGDDASLVRMFLDEARLSARLSHPNIVQTYEVSDANRKYFIAMEYLEGQSLESLLNWLTARGAPREDTDQSAVSGARPVPSSSEGLRETIAALIAMQVARGLHYAHELADYDGTPLGVVHRDVSPHNVFITYRGEVKLLDFGIAKASVNVSETETGVLKGKIRYMAPEQIADNAVDRRADIFALGIVLWEMLARRRLFEGDSVSVLKRISRGEIVPLRSVRPDVSLELDAIVTRALRRDPADRYATAGEMGLALEQFLQSRSDPGTEAALARMVGEGFSATRENVQSRIKTFLAMVTSGEAESIGEIPVQLPALHGDGSGPKTTLHAPLSELTKDSTKPSRTEAKKPPWLLIAIAALLVGGSGALALRHLGTTEPSAPAANDPAPPPPMAAQAVTLPAAAPVESAVPPPPGAVPPSTVATSAPTPATSPPHRSRHAAATSPPQPAPPAPSASPRPKIRVIDDNDSR